MPNATRFDEITHILGANPNRSPRPFSGQVHNSEPTTVDIAPHGSLGYAEPLSYLRDGENRFQRNSQHSELLGYSIERSLNPRQSRFDTIVAMVRTRWHDHDLAESIFTYTLVLYAAMGLSIG